MKPLLFSCHALKHVPKGEKTAQEPAIFTRNSFVLLDSKNRNDSSISRDVGWTMSAESLILHSRVTLLLKRSTGCTWLAQFNLRKRFL